MAKTKLTKWKYGTVPAAQRLSMLREGNKELYDEEIARTRDVITDRLSAGLSVDEQMKWGDTISYQYNLSNAEKAGLSPDSVAKSGYSEKLFGDLAVSNGSTTSTVASPKKVNTESYRDNYKNETTESLGKAVNEAYAAAINRRLSELSAQYNRYVSDVTAQYEAQKRQVLDDYEKQEEYYREKELNEGTVGGGRSETTRLKAKQALDEALSTLAERRDRSIAEAHEAAQSSVYDIARSAMTTFSDEYYKYNALSERRDERDVERERNAIEDTKWWEELAQKARDNALDRDDLRAYREAQLALDKEKLAFDREKRESDEAAEKEQLEYKKQADALDYEKWLREFEEDSALARAELARKLENDRRDAAFDDEAKELSDRKENQYGENYWTVYAQAKEMLSKPVYDAERKTYRFKYSGNDVRNWIARQGLTVAEREKMLKELGLLD